MNAKCGVGGCNEHFHSAINWYKHVRLQHTSNYYQTTILNTTIEPDCDVGSEQPDSLEDLMDIDSRMLSGEHSISENELSISENEHSSISDNEDEMITATILNLKDKHKMSQAAFDDVTKLMEHVCSHMKKKAVQDIEMLTGGHTIDKNSQLYKGMVSCINEVESPISTPGSAYQQKNFLHQISHML